MPDSLVDAADAIEACLVRRWQEAKKAAVIIARAYITYKRWCAIKPSNNIALLRVPRTCAFVPHLSH